MAAPSDERDPLIKFRGTTARRARVSAKGPAWQPGRAARTSRLSVLSPHTEKYFASG